MQTGVAGQSGNRSFAALVGLLIGGCILVMGLLWGGSRPSVAIAGDTSGVVRMGSTGNEAELVKTLPIGKSTSKAKRKVVMSLESSELGTIRKGDRVVAAAEWQVSVNCFEPDSRCFGPIYSYTPSVRWKFVLANDAKASSDQNTLAIGKWHNETCSNDVPDRNHHCVYTAKDAVTIDKISDLPCTPNSCKINLVAQAFDKKADRGDLIAVGNDLSTGQIDQDRGRIFSTLMHTGVQAPDDVVITKKRRDSGIRVVEDGTPETIVYTKKIKGLKAGEQLDITSKLVGKVPGYNVLFVAQIVLSNSRSKLDLAEIRNFMDDGGLVNKSNGFNCVKGGGTQHSSPCTRFKFANVRVIKDFSTNGPRSLFVHVVASANYQPPYRFTGGNLKILRKGFLKIERFGPDRDF